MITRTTMLAFGFAISLGGAIALSAAPAFAAGGGAPSHHGGGGAHQTVPPSNPPPGPGRSGQSNCQANGEGCVKQR